MNIWSISGFRQHVHTSLSLFSGVSVDISFILHLGEWSFVEGGESFDITDCSSVSSLVCLSPFEWSTSVGELPRKIFGWGLHLSLSFIRGEEDLLDILGGDNAVLNLALQSIMLTREPVLKWSGEEVRGIGKFSALSMGEILLQGGLWPSDVGKTSLSELRLNSVSEMSLWWSPPSLCDDPESPAMLPLGWSSEHTDIISFESSESWKK